MRLIYPLLWSALSRDAGHEQSVNTAAALARHGVDVTMLMPRVDGEASLSADDLRAYFEVEGGFSVVQRESAPVGPSIGPSTKWLRRVFRDPLLRGADVLYSRIPVSLALGGSSPLPFAFDHYRPWPDEWPWLRPLIRRTARSGRCLGFISHSDYAAQSYRRARVSESQILVAHNGADPRRMLPRLEKPQARALLSLPATRSIALYAGRINAEKGLDQVLALAALRPDVLFLLVGSEGHGPIELAASALRNVQVVPWQTPSLLPRWLYAADVLLVPSSSAPLERYGHCVLPLKVFQYLATGRPILAPRSPDTAELLRDGDTACLVAPDDPGAAAAALDRLLHDPMLANRVADGALRQAADLSWDQRATTIAAFLERRLAALNTA